MRHRIPFSTPRDLLIVGLAALIALIGNSLYRNKTDTIWSHPDQAIPVEVLQTMHAHGDLNTDWARADLPSYFQACRFNFSGYLIAAHLTTRALAPGAFADDGHLIKHLLRFSRWCAALTLAIVFAVCARKLGIAYGLVGAAAVAWMPQFYQDAHYPRPEAFATLCATACFALATIKPKSRLAALLLVAAIGGLAGFLATIKFTLVVFGLFALAPLIWLRSRHPLGISDWAVAAACGGGALLIGFVAGAPGAVLDPGGYLDGIRALKAQYSGSHPPHSRMDHGVREQAALIFGFYFATLGLPAAVLHALGYARGTFAPAKYVYAAILAATLLGFLSQKVFFERNFSPMIPAFVVIMVLGMDNVRAWIAGDGSVRWKAACAPVIAVAIFAASQVRPLAITVPLSAYFSESALRSELDVHSELKRDIAGAIGAGETLGVPFGAVHALQYPTPGNGCTLYETLLFGDDWSDRFLSGLPPEFRVARIVASKFADVPTSTLHTYHSASTLLFYAHSSCSPAAPAALAAIDEPAGRGSGGRSRSDLAR